MVRQRNTQDTKSANGTILLKIIRTIPFWNRAFGFEIRKNQPDQNSAIIGNDSIKLCLYEVENFTQYEKKAIIQRCGVKFKTIKNAELGIT